MRCEWKEIKVADLGKIVTGKTPKTAIVDNYGGEIPFLTPSDDMSAKYVRNTTKTLTERGLKEVKNSLLPANSVCVSCIGSDLGKVVISCQPMVTNQQINSIIVEQSKYDISFIYYSMLILGRRLNFISKTSTAVPIVNKSSFSSYTIKCPPLTEQQKIASVLSALDDKIELNQRINENLERQARAIYHKWLADNSGKLELHLLSEIAIINPDTYSLKESWEYFNYLDTSNITNGDISEIQHFTQTEKLPSRARRKVISGDIVFSTVRPNQKHYGVIFPALPNMLVSTGFAVIRSTLKHVCNELIYLQITEDAFVEKMQQLAEQSTSTFPSIKPSDLGSYPVSCPSERDGLELSKQLKAIFTLAAIKREENEKLSALRDTLLPEFMAGKIRIP